ncbi:MAG TPA: lmo0937 family membrane protein [Fibrobacteria bacterium]|nr:lmo0937 family membrane protein [Fibrobacteria bacterium]
MFYAIVASLLIFWLAGVVSALAAGGLIHILLVVAIVMLLLQAFNGRRVI